MTSDNATSKPSPMMEQYLAIKKVHPDKFVFFRLGDFYELFYDDAIIAARLLHITLTKRHDIPMCGVPHHQLYNYTPKLIRLGKKIAVVEQVENPTEAKGIVKREISQILTPSTTTEIDQIDHNCNNYLCSLTLPPNLIEKVNEKQNIPYTFAALDISTGENEMLNDVSNKMILHIETLLNRYQPKELLISDAIDETYFKKNFISPTFSSILITSLPKYLFKTEYALNQLKTHLGLHSLKGFGFNEQDPHFSNHVAAWYSLIHYLKETKRCPLSHIRSPKFISKSDTMQIDSTTQKNLEITFNNYDHTEKHSLLWAINRTITAMGSRALRQMLYKPLLNKQTIDARLGQVTFFVENKPLMRSARENFKRIFDIERTCARISMNKILPQEFIALKDSLIETSALFELLQANHWPFALPINVTTLRDISNNIEHTLLEKPSNAITEGDIIASRANEELKRYRSIMDDGSEALLQLQLRERKSSNINTLKIKYSQHQGYFFEVSKSHLNNVPSHFIHKQTLINGSRYTTQELLDYQENLINTDHMAKQLEYNLYQNFKHQLAKHVSLLQEVSEVCAHLDITSSFAELALVQGYVKPTIHEGSELIIKGGRHPVVEQVEKNVNDFIPNDLEIGSANNSIHIITGPNMAGKSTFLRQNALIVLLAQIGSYVPASSASVPICDRIFTRIGASDNLAKGESTFLVEMNETANILNNTTNKSLIIIDEIGRGTSTYDGLALAQGILEYLQKKNQGEFLGCKVLFATHYHELASLKEKQGVSNFNVAVQEDKDKLIFLKKVQPGFINRSYGIQVAQMSGLPTEVIKRSEEILAHINQKSQQPVNEKPTSTLRETSHLPPSETNIVKESEIEREIKTVNLVATTPLHALSLIEKWQNLLK